MTCGGRRQLKFGKHCNLFTVNKHDAEDFSTVCITNALLTADTREAVYSLSAQLQNSKDQHSWKTHGADLGRAWFLVLPVTLRVFTGTTLRVSRAFKTFLSKKRKKKNLVWNRRRRRHWGERETDGQPGDLTSSETLQQWTQVAVFDCSSRKWHIRLEWTATFLKSSSSLLHDRVFRFLPGNFSKQKGWTGTPSRGVTLVLPSVSTRDCCDGLQQHGRIDITHVESVLIWKPLRLEIERKQTKAGSHG